MRGVALGCNQTGNAFAGIGSIAAHGERAGPFAQRQPHARSAALKAAADAWGVAYTTHLSVGTYKGHATYNYYVRVRTLGRGSSGVVELCGDRRSGQLRALKLISRKRQRRLSLVRARLAAATASPAVALGQEVDELTDVAREVDVLGRLLALRGVIDIYEVIGVSAL